MNIHGVPEIAHKSPKIPLPCDLNCCIEGHCKECNEQIRESKWNQEIVVDMSKPSVEDDTDNNKNVVDDSKKNDGDDDDALDHKKSDIQVCCSPVTKWAVRWDIFTTQVVSIFHPTTWHWTSHIHTPSHKF